MSVWYALLWGAVSSAALFIGQAIADPLRTHRKATGLLMGFGAGTLLSAIAYELIPLSSFGTVYGLGLWFMVGALTYYVADRLVDQSGGEDRQDLDAGEGGSGAAMFVGALLDGLPEAFVLGIGLALGGGVSVAFVAAVFISNIPQGVAGTTSLKAAGYTGRHVFGMWTSLTVVSALAAAAGFLLADSVPDQGLWFEAFAGGAVLTMLANSMMPEAFEHGGNAVGLVTVLGFFVAGALAVLS